MQDRILGEGIHPIVPLMTNVQKISVRIQKTDVAAAAASRDLQDIQADIALNWHVDPTKVNEIYQQIGTIDTIVNSIINPAVSEVVKASVPRRTVADTLRDRGKLKEEIDTALEQRLAAYGIIVDDVSLVNFAFSPEFKAAIEAKQVAEQEAQKAAFRAQQAEQDAKAEINRAKGQAEAQRLLRQNLTAEILQQQAIAKWDGRYPTVVAGEGSLPLLNLDRAIAGK
ncbi:MAG: prohibitin family protein [Oculatellaceae cyanobacterium Prado106]|nr:prohibitin family protein [Oculatellaceae cyanobacterium Prado106]